MMFIARSEGDAPRRRPSGRWLLVPVLALLVVACGEMLRDDAMLGVAPPPGMAPEELGRIWERERLSLPVAPLLRHAEVERRLADVQRSAPDLFSLEKLGESVEGRGIHHLRFGTGEFRVLLWSQMHGDEPTATSALFDLYEYVRRHQAEAHVRRMLDHLTVHTVPMLNPDGAERFDRRNAQSIDVNRDALLLQTPEGRILKELRDRLEPRIGFNLHNQDWRTSVGRPPAPASISLLAVAYDEARSDNPGRILAKQISAVIREAIEPFAEGRIGRYDDSFEPRAFGDNITLWGTSVILIETGAWPSDEPDGPLVKLNFVALVSALDAIASGRAEFADPGFYEELPLNESRMFYRLIRNATIVPGTGVDPFIGDVGIVATRGVSADGDAPRVTLTARIEDVGDLRVFGGLQTIDATGLTVTPRFDMLLGPGDATQLPDWSLRAGNVIAVGQPADLMLLLPSATEGEYVVERIIEIR